MRALARIPTLNFKSRLESDYADLLTLRKLAREILRWEYEPIKFRLGEGAYYKPDFLIVMADRSIEIHETKGFKREAAMVRIRAAASIHDYVSFTLVTRKSGQWDYERF